MLQDYLIDLFKKLFGIIIIIILALFIIGCSPMKWTTIGNGGRMKMIYDMKDISLEQVDSICESESISNRFKKDWVYLPLLDNETSEPIEKFMFIEKMDSLEIMYFVSKHKGNNTYRMAKRITYN